MFSTSSWRIKPGWPTEKLVTLELLDEKGKAQAELVVTRASWSEVWTGKKPPRPSMTMAADHAQYIHSGH